MFSKILGTLLVYAGLVNESYLLLFMGLVLFVGAFITFHPKEEKD